MKLTIRQIAAQLGADIIGNGGTAITGVSSFDDAAGTDITFAMDAAYLSRLDRTGAGAVLVPASFTPKDACRACLILTEQPKRDFFKIVARFHPPAPPAGRIDPGAVIGENCTLGEAVTIEANAVIRDNVTIGSHVHILPNVYVGEGCQLGDHTRINPNVTLMERSRIGSHVIIHSGSVIGSDGYGFVQEAGTHTKLPHTGFVEIGDHSEIGACNTIDRGTLGVTRIGSGVKTDNQIHIGHNCKIGDHSLIVAQVGIAGSTTIGKNVILAGKAGISGHLTIGDNAIVGPYAGVSANVEANRIVSGIPHLPHKTWLKVANIIGRLPDMRKKLMHLEKKLRQLENKTEKPEQP